MTDAEILAAVERCGARVGEAMFLLAPSIGPTPDVMAWLKGLAREALLEEMPQVPPEVAALFASHVVDGALGRLAELQASASTEHGSS